MKKANRTTALVFAGAVVLLGSACSDRAADDKAKAAAAAAASAAVGGASGPVAQTVEQLEAAVPDNPLKEAYFGETHVHTSYSLDAYIGGARLTPDDAYKFAQGKDVTIQGQTHNIKRPLDWTAVSDHAEFIGEMYSTQVPGAKGGDNPMLEELRGLKSVDEQRAWFLKYVINNMRGANPGHPPFYAGAGDDAERVEGRPAEGRARQLPARQVHDAGGLRVDRRDQCRQHAPQRHLPRPDRAGHAAARRSTRRRGEALGLDGRAGEAGLEAAGDSAQLQRQQGLHVRARGQRRQAPDGGVREAAQPLRAR